MHLKFVSINEKPDIVIFVNRVIKINDIITTCDKFLLGYDNYKVVRNDITLSYIRTLR